MPRGKLAGSPYQGKFVDTWYYSYQGIPEAEDELPAKNKVKRIKVPVELRLHKKYGDSEEPPLETKEVWFTVSCKQHDFKLEGSDIEALRAAMWGKLDKQYAVKWERYFLVEIEPRAPYEGMGTGFTFSYKDVEKGTAWDGTLLMKSYVRHEHKDKIVPWPGQFTNNRGTVIACIEGSEANRDSLTEFARRINTLREKLADYLRPETIHDTLLQLGTFKLLPTGNPDEK